MGRDEMGSIEMFHYRHCTLHGSQNTEKKHSKKNQMEKQKPQVLDKSYLTGKIAKTMIQSSVKGN